MTDRFDELAREIWNDDVFIPSVLHWGHPCDENSELRYSMKDEYNTAITRLAALLRERETANPALHKVDCATGAITPTLPANWQEAVRVAARECFAVSVRPSQSFLPTKHASEWDFAQIITSALAPLVEAVREHIKAALSLDNGKLDYCEDKDCDTCNHYRAALALLGSEEKEEKNGQS